MKFSRLAVIAALLGYSVAVNGSIKQRLSEIANAGTGTGLEPPEPCVLGALPEPDLSWCTCDLTPIPP